MVENESLDKVFAALADPSRRHILAMLGEGPKPVGALAKPLPMSLAAASKHIDVLERAGLVTRRAEGRQRICALAPAPLGDASTWLSTHARFWSDRLDALADALKEDDQ